MADDNREGSSNTGIVAVVVIFIIVAVLGFIGWQKGMFGGAPSHESKVNVELNTQAPPAPAAPAPENPATPASPAAPSSDNPGNPPP